MAHPLRSISMDLAAVAPVVHLPRFDVGGGTGSSSYWEQRFGDGYFDPSSFIPSYTTTDKVLAIFRLAVGTILVVLGSYPLVRFYRSRWILDIRTR
ncbi:unnamed protein product [Ectocarpus sp. CCAP 1310/34]|nr:unnamed protein product [Ectocarpus sp. CCAP 1310/34]